MPRNNLPPCIEQFTIYFRSLPRFADVRSRPASILAARCLRPSAPQNRRAGCPALVIFAYCDCGTCGPPVGGAGCGASCPCSSLSSPPPPGASGGLLPGTAGWLWPAGAPVLRIELGLRSKLASQDSINLVA